MTSPATPQATRGWWPRSLLGRNLLLMAVLIVLGQLVAAVLVRQMIFQPRVAQVADGVARNVGALRAGLQALPPAQRAAFVEAFNQQAVRSLPPVAAESTVRRALLSPMERQFVQAVSRRLGEEGRVLLAVQVDADGAPRQVRIARSSGYPRLDAAALAAVEKWRFVPARQGEHSVAASVNVPIHFRLDDAA
mgnify:CR=1 FL=1